MIRLTTIKHIASKNANYGDAELYLTMEHDEFTMKPVLNNDGSHVPRESYLLETILCDGEDFAIACMKANLRFHKNNHRGDIKSHHYIISFDPRDAEDHGLTMERAQALGMEFCREHFPGHQAIVCTHPDGHNQSGNIHCHIVINSLRIEDVPFMPFMDRPCDTKAGMKHRCTAAAFRYLRSEVMEMCHREGLYQIDLLSGREDRITEREYWAQRRGQQRLEAKVRQESIPEKSGALTSGDDTISSAFVAEQKSPTKFETDKEKLRRAIRTAKEKASSFEEFESLLSEAGIIVKESRGRWSYLTLGRKKPITARKLGDAYSKEAVLGRLERNRLQRANARAFAEASPVTSPAAVKTSAQVTPIQEPRVCKAIDIEAKMVEGKGGGYRQWASVFNLKQKAMTLTLCREYGFDSAEDLDAAIEAAQKNVETDRSRIRELETAIREKKELQRHVMNYRAAKDDYAAYKGIRSQSKRDAFYEDHRQTLMPREVAERYLKERGISKLPSYKALQAEIESLIEEKNARYQSYHNDWARLKELLIIRSNIESTLGTNHAIERDHGTPSL